ncbi:MAG: flagellar biosynthesis anti-sigma factor FlgM [Dehalococcoidia bacterium]|nr:flagellar biosynthesis anti-sigma factor FlgM [Dehalococcoidia bacterium]
MTRIDGLNPLISSRTSQGQSAGGVDQTAGRQDGAGESPQNDLDHVSLSNRGRMVAATARAVANSPEVRMRQVAALKAAIASGAYSSDAREIAIRLAATGTFE